MSIVKLIEAIIEIGLSVYKTTRDSLAQDLEEIARRVRDGELLADDLFEKAKNDLEEVKDIRDSLPD